ncbi:protein retinal degeneration B [Eurytemora carolleeae]|uniref:protein retinal degeneration B n=1 Tax=Eurytemora carolleeae TaxID=1294199 RepID=UPI000C76CA34|nr:protein retinal degeneration B [Eurytemora carolleeae]|eukprot:XP_023349192.1 protein retinal degeneration B-like [Eurytemora affinis]
MPTPNGKAIMCAYKLCKVEFRYWGMQSKLERFIHDMALRNTMLRAHRQAWVWQDEWFGLTMDDIRNIERETAEMLARTMHGEELSEDEDDVVEAIPDPAGGNHKGSVSASFTSIEKPTIPTENELESPNVFSDEDPRFKQIIQTATRDNDTSLSLWKSLQIAELFTDCIF